MALLWGAALVFVVGLNVLQHELNFLSLTKTVRAYEQGFVKPSPGWAAGELKTATKAVLKTGPRGSGDPPSGPERA